MELRFFKLDGAGNDFVGIDWRGRPDLPADDLSALTRALCDRHHGVGADGILLVRDSPQPAFHFAMRYVNADGSVGEMCGNGARCIAVFAHALEAAPAAMRFLTDAGPYEARVLPGSAGAAVSFPDVPFLPEKRILRGPLQAGRELLFLEVGVPHAVLFCEDLEEIEVEQLGREIRHDPAFSPRGTNANFVEERDGILHIRTYERGVEVETLACGTGSVASVCCLLHLRGVSGSHTVPVLPTGRMPLSVTAEATAGGFRGIQLAGPARMVFEGSCRWTPESGVRMP